MLPLEAFPDSTVTDPPPGHTQADPVGALWWICGTLRAEVSLSTWSLLRDWEPQELEAPPAN